MRVEGGAKAEIAGNTLIKENKAIGNADNADRFGGAINIKKGQVTISGDVEISGNSVESGLTYGGAIHVSGMGSDEGILIVNGGRITGNTAGGKEGTYINKNGNNAKVQQAYGGAISVRGSNARVKLSAGTIVGNTVVGSNDLKMGGAGIYVFDGGVVEVSGAPDFGGKGTDAEGNLVTTTIVDGKTVAAGNFLKLSGYSEKKNGGKSFLENQVREDIYIAGKAESGEAIKAISVTGAITTGNGTIWVWAEDANHYDMLKQFAVFDGDGTELNDDVKESTMKVFRNAQADSETNCGGDYLTGQKGEEYKVDVGGYERPRTNGLCVVAADGGSAGRRNDVGSRRQRRNRDLPQSESDVIPVHQVLRTEEGRRAGAVPRRLRPRATVECRMRCGTGGPLRHLGAALPEV